MALISMRHVSKIYPKSTRPALQDINLEIDRGDFVFLVGASGSGKSTLLRLLLREEEATDGEIRVAGNDLRRLSNHQVPLYRRSLGFVFQDYKLLMNKTVWQNVAFALEVIGTSRSAIKSMVPKVLQTVGLNGKERNYPHELSGGEAQRVAIARAYVNHPQILLADEPTGNLDPTTSLGIMEVLDAINRTGTTVVMATHNEEIVNSMRKRVVELHTGRMVRDEVHGSYDSSVFFSDDSVEQLTQVHGHGHTSESILEPTSVQASQPEQVQLLATAVESNVDARHEPIGALGDDGEDQSSAAATPTDAKPHEQGQTAMATQGGDKLGETPAVDHSASAGERHEGGTPRSVGALEESVEQGDEGISRLAKSVHSGRTGRYRVAFASAETTMTWGHGLAEPVDSTPPSPPDPPAPTQGDAQESTSEDEHHHEPGDGQ